MGVRRHRPGLLRPMGSPRPRRASPSVSGAATATATPAQPREVAPEPAARRRRPPAASASGAGARWYRFRGAHLKGEAFPPRGRGPPTERRSGLRECRRRYSPRLGAEVRAGRTWAAVGAAWGPYRRDWTAGSRSPGRRPRADGAGVGGGAAGTRRGAPTSIARRSARRRGRPRGSLTGGPWNHPGVADSRVRTRGPPGGLRHPDTGTTWGSLTPTHGPRESPTSASGHERVHFSPVWDCRP